MLSNDIMLANRVELRLPTAKLELQRASNIGYHTRRSRPLEPSQVGDFQVVLALQSHQIPQVPPGLHRGKGARLQTWPDSHLRRLRRGVPDLPRDAQEEWFYSKARQYEELVRSAFFFMFLLGSESSFFYERATLDKVVYYLFLSISAARLMTF